jgi:hypothetical protein
MRTLTLTVLLACFSTAVVAANDITGHVQNRTRGAVSAGDAVVLLRLGHGSHEEAGRTTTDTQGAFTLKVPSPGTPYLIRAIHDGIDYEQQASVGEDISIDVFDAAPKVQGITGSIEILRTGTNGSLLHVSDMYEIRNDSHPPFTLIGERTFEVRLPAEAKIDSVLAAGPEKNATMISTAPIAGEPGHYSVNFPLRPGATRFAFNYDLPYKGSAAFRTWRAYPLQQLAVMIPRSMKFSSSSRDFQILAVGNPRYQVHAAGHLQAGEGPAFEVSGNGLLPTLGDQAKPLEGTESSALPNPVQSGRSRAVSPSLVHLDSGLQKPARSSESLILSVLSAALLGACLFLVWRGRRPAIRR